MTEANATRTGSPPQLARIDALDLLRGLGVLGILAVNAASFAYPWYAYSNPMMGPFPFEGLEASSWFVSHVFFEFKFITLFSMLFGVSVFLVGGERGDLIKSPILRRRLGWMILFGLVHGLVLWYGDVLLAYALCGFMLLLCRSWRPSRLLLTGVLLLILGAANWIALAVLALLPEGAMSQAELDTLASSFWVVPQAALLEAIAQFRGDAGAVAAANAETWFLFQVFGFPVATAWRTLGVMMIGLALFKMGPLAGKGRTSTYLVWVGLGAASLVAVALAARQQIDIGFAFPAAAGLNLLPNYFLSPLITLGYAAVLILVLRANILRTVVRVLSAVGRMAFTNYILQTLIMTSLFWGGRGPTLFAEVDRAGQWMIVAAIWSAQLIWSPLWLRFFQYGPLEWVWRKLSYGGEVPFRRPAVQPSVT